MKQNIFIFGIVFIVLSSFVSASIISDLNNGAIHYYKLEENGATPYVDEVSTADLTVAGLPDRTTGIIDFGQNFVSGSSEYLKTVASVSEESTNIVASMWIKVTSIGSEMFLIDEYRSDAGNKGYTLRITSTGKIHFHVFGTAGYDLWESTTTLSTATWYHVVAVFTGGDASLYINGVSDGSLTTDTTSDVLWSSGNHAFVIGRAEPDSAYFSGIIDEVYYGDVSGFDSTYASFLYNGGSPTSSQQYSFSSGVDAFTLTSSMFFNDNPINLFAVNISNTTGVRTISTNNGSVYYPKDLLINLSVYNVSGFVKGVVLNHNTTNDLDIALKRFELHTPLNETIINDSDTGLLSYNMANASAFTSCSLLFNESIQQTNYSVINGINSFPVLFTQNDELEWYVSCDVYNTSNKYALTLNVSNPNIINFTPTINDTYAENQTVAFNISYDSELIVTFNWFVDGILKAITQAFDWVIGQFDAGTNINVTAIVEDSFSQTDSNTWIVNVTETNFPPFVEEFTVSLATIYENLPYDILCYVNDSDTNSSNLTVTIQYNDGSGWIDTIESYISENEFKSVIPAFTHSQDAVISYRCKGADDDPIPSVSEWYVLTNYRTVGEEQTPPETPQILLPTYTMNKYAIPIICMGSYDNQYLTQNIFYEVYMRKNSTSWGLIRNMSEAVIYSYNIADDGYNTTYDLRCRAWDGVEYSDFITNINASIKDNVPVFQIMDVSDNKQFISGTPYQQGYFIDVDALGSDYSIFKVTTECNQDGLLDYIFDHDFSKKVKGTYTCINHAGVFEHTINAIIYKNNTDEIWESVCNGLDPTDQYCKLSKTYEVIVNE